MIRPSDRSVRRRDTVLFLVCVVLSVVALFLPPSLALGLAGGLRDSVLAPLVWLQARAEEGRTSRERFRVVAAERDSAALVAQFLPALAAENERLRELLGLSRRLRPPFVAAEVLHQSQATDSRMLLLDVGAGEGIRPFDPIVAPTGLIGVVASVGARTSVGMTWAHPEFRVSAFTVDGNAFGIVAPSTGPRASESALELRGVPYRDSIPSGTEILSSGLGGVYPKGIPIGTVTGIAREQAGWERVYRVDPAANPASAGHVLILVTPRAPDVIAAFPNDSMLAAARRDSLERVRVADSVAAARRVADSVAAAARAARAREAAAQAAREAAARAARAAESTRAARIAADTAARDTTP